MKLLILIGDAAVGKMTVGQDLMERTGMRLFHNHMTIEPVLEIFGSFHGPTISRMREVIFEEFAKTDQYGLIFTYMWAFDQKSDWDYVAHVTKIFKRQKADIYYVELIAPQEVRLLRNETKNRLDHKPSKRNLDASRERLLEDNRNYRCVSFEGEIPFDNYMRIENSNLDPGVVAKMIQERFSL